jgi:hypothetical protein
MRTLELSEVVCEGCRHSQPRDQWGSRCSSCHGETFHIDLQRRSEGFDLSGRNGGGGEIGLLLDAVTNDVGGPGLYFQTHAWLECGAVSPPEIAAFRTAPLEERIRSYMSWKRRELEGSLPQGKKICGRCKVAFTVYDNAWNRDGFCSKACHQAFLKSWAR